MKRKEISPDKAKEETQDLEDEKIVQLDCFKKHIFHYKCMYQWAEYNVTCPICKADILKTAK